MITSLLLSNVRHRPMITPVSRLLTTFIHIINEYRRLVLPMQKKMNIGV